MIKNLMVSFSSLGKKAILIPLIYMSAIFVLSSIPDDNSTIVARYYQQIIPGIQNLLHIPLFAGLTGLWILSLQNWNLSLKHLLLWSFLITCIYSLFDEFHQYFVPGRFPGLVDILLNTCGVVCTTVLFYFKLNSKIRYTDNRFDLFGRKNLL